MQRIRRIEWLDYMKGVAILIVVLGHIAQHIEGDYVFTKPIIVCEMPLFFMLSGILANKITNRTVLEKSYPIEHNKYLRKYILGKF